jgi:hypothetical protein
MGTSRASVHVDLVLYSHEADFMQSFLNKNEEKLVRSFSLTFRYIDDVLSLDNCLVTIPLGIRVRTKPSQREQKHGWYPSECLSTLLKYMPTKHNKYVVFSYEVCTNDHYM